MLLYFFFFDNLYVVILLKGDILWNGDSNLDEGPTS